MTQRDNAKTEEMTELRRKAEAQLKKKIVRLREQISGDPERVLAELQVHQIELEMQNEELRRAQHELEESRQKYADLYEFAPIGYFTFDTYGHIVEANLTGCQMLGVERSAIINKLFRSFVARESQDQFHLHRRAALTPGLKQTCEITLVRKDGEKFEARLDSILVLNHGERVIGSRVAVIDVTEEKHAGAALRESEERYRTFFENSLDAVLLTCPDGSIEEANAAACEMFQMSAEELRKAGRSGIVDRSDPRIARFLEERAQAGHFRGELNFRRKDGTVFPGEISSAVFTGAGGTARTAMIIRDITERKRAEEALGQEKESYRTLAENLPGLVYRLHLGEQRRMEFFDQSLVALTGYAETELTLGELCLIDPLIVAEDHDAAVKAVQRAIREHQPFAIEFRLRTKAGEVRHFGGRGQPVYAPDGVCTHVDGLIFDITERREAEENLRQSERRERERAAELATLLDAIPTPVFIVHDPEGNHITGNRAADRLLRIPSGAEASLSAPAETRPRHYRVVKDGRELNPDELPGHRAARGEHVQDFEFNLVFDDGEQRSVMGYATPLRDDEGKSRGAVDVLVDLTERKKAEEAVRREAQILAQVHDCVVTTDLQGNITLWNRGAERVFGYSADEALGQNISLVYFDEDLPILSDVIIAPMLERSENELEVRCRHKSGREVFLHLSLSVLRDENGSPIELIGYSLDVTERKKAEEALRESEEKFRLLAETSPAAILIYQDGKYVYVNPAAESITGYTRAELLAQAPGDIVEPYYHEQVRQMLSRREQGEGPPVHYELEILTKDGQRRWMDCRSASIRYKNKPAGLVVAFDVTERKRAEEALRRSQHRLKLAQVAAGAGVWEWDITTGKLEWSEELFALFGLDPAKYKASFETWRSVLHPDDRLVVQKRIGKAIENRTPLNSESRVVLESGQVRWINALGDTTYDDEGKPQRMSGICLDMTGRKLAEEQIRNIARFPDENPFPVLRLSADGTILYSNTPGQVLLEQWDCQTGQKAPEYWCSLVRKSLRYNRNEVERTKCADRIYSFTITPVRDAKYVNLYGRDITIQEQVKGFLRKSRGLLEERVSERTAELVKAVAMLEGEIEQRKRTERLLRLEEARLEALLHVTNIHEGSIDEICRFILEQGIALTNSKIGFIGFLSEDESVYTLHAVSKAIAGQCDVAGDPMHWPVGSAGIWADAIRQRKTLFINDYRKAQSGKKGLPAGHIPLDRFMIVPLFEGDRIVVVAGVGNKTSNYDGSDERQMALLLAGMWNYVQRKRAAEALQQRTAELSKLNVELEKEIAERRRAEDSLRERSRDLNALFSHTITPLVILDREFNFVRVNKAYADSCGRDISEFAGHNHFEFYPHEENQQIFEQVVRTKASYEAFAKPFSYPDHPEWGVTYWDWTLVPVLDESRQVELLIFSLKDVTERVRAENEIRANQRALREMAAELQLAEERERRQIAQDLHDSIGQILAFSGRELRSLRKSLPDQSAGIIAEVVEQLDTAVGQTRTLSFDLSPGILYDLGFEAAVEDLIDKMNEAGRIQCTFQSCSYPKPLADDVKILLYRSIRELLINAAKHAKADKVEVCLLRSDCDIYVKVEDDGRGFDADILNDDLKKRKGFGLFSIRERLNHIGGSLKIESARGKGTKAILTAPLDI